MTAIAELKFRRGAVQEQYLEDGAGAVASYREALELEPSHVGARTALQAYLSSNDADLQQAAVAVLEPIYESNGDIARLVEVQRIKLAHEKRSDKRVALLLKIGELEGRLGNTDQAWEAYTRAVTENPASAPAREALENLATILDNWQPLVALYEKALSAKGKEKLPSALERELLLVVAVAYDEKLGQSDRAVEYFRRAQSIQPEDASALVALERLYTRTERWSDLVDTLLKKAQLVTDAAEREEIRIRIATVWEEMLGNAEQAIVAWNVVLQDNPGNAAPSRPSIASTCPAASTGSSPTTCSASSAFRPAIRRRPSGCSAASGVLREQHLAEIGGAVETYAKILELEPEHAETIAALERILPKRGARGRRRPAAGADLQDPGRLAAAHLRLRGRGAARDRSRAEDRALQADRRGLRDRTRRSGARLRGARPGRSPRIPRTPRSRRASSGSRARCASSTI